MTDEVMIVPAREFEHLTDYYKVQISERALLNKAGLLVAEQHLILNNPKIPNATAIKMVKRLAQQQARLTNHILLGLTPSDTAPTLDEEDGGMAEGLLENLWRKIIKGTTPKRKAIITFFTPATSGSMSTKKEHLLPLTLTILETHHFLYPLSEERNERG